MLFYDAHYDEAIPFIIKKINAKELYNRNGTLVFALEGMDSLAYFTDIIKIMCEQDYEARLMAYTIVDKLSVSISDKVRRESLTILEDNHLKQPDVDDDNYENSTLHFIEATQKMLLNFQGT